MKVVINNCYGGFSISRECAEYMESLGDEQAAAELKQWREQKNLFDHFIQYGEYPEGTDPDSTRFLDIDIKYRSEPTFHGYGYGKGFDGGYRRDSETLIKAVEHLGKKAGGAHASLKVVEIPDGIEWEIDEYDGNESISEKHRTWH